MSNEDYEWKGERLFNWYSKEARVIRAYLVLESRHEYLEEQWHKLINLRDDTDVAMDLHAFCDRMIRFRRAANRLRDRLGCSNKAAADAFHERWPRLPGETSARYYDRIHEIGAK